MTIVLVFAAYCCIGLLIFLRTDSAEMKSPEPYAGVPRRSLSMFRRTACLMYLVLWPRFLWAGWMHAAELRRTVQRGR